MADNEFNGYIGKRERFTFNESGALTIPKTVRQKAYHISVDIEILSVAKQSYLNYKSVPAHGFYGYVIIVLRDMSVLKIPIENSRQRLFTETIHNAFSNWYSFYLNFKDRKLGSRNHSYLALIASQLDIVTLGEIPEAAIFGGFVETEIREVYIKTAFGTRFAIETSWYEPVPVKYNGVDHDGESQRTDDPEKDKGLPIETQPAVAENSSSPYAGYPEPSSGTDKATGTGNWNNIRDLLGLDNPNGANVINQFVDDNGDGFDDNLRSNCTVTITVMYGNGTTNVNTSAIEVPRGHYFGVENYGDPTSPTGNYNGVTIYDGLGRLVGWFQADGIIHPPEPKLSWSSSPVTVSAVCTAIN